VVANRVIFLDRKGAAASSGDEKGEDVGGGDVEPEDLPF
jgi:hypothetical protein